jgi:hypothetical protein
VAIPCTVATHPQKYHVFHKRFLTCFRSHSWNTGRTPLADASNTTMHHKGKQLDGDKVNGTSGF